MNATKSQPKNIVDIVERYRPDLSEFEEIYKDLHKNPELGTKEKRTAGIIAKCLIKGGFDVHDNIGGYGLAAVLRRGDGPTVLLRADMDALALEEETGLDYKSTVPNTMHACGHDMHVTCLLTAAKLLNAARSEWSGTLICVFQPNEENGAGAKAMVNDGLYKVTPQPGGVYKVIPKPDVVLGQHVSHMKAGTLSIGPGVTLSAADSFKVTIHGRSGHGSQPENCIDPIVIASSIVVRLQSVVSRVISPSDSAVVTCGSFHGGESENAIPDRVVLKLNVRTQNDKVREKVLSAVKRIIKAECEAGGATQPPDIEPTSRFPLTENDPKIVDKLHDAFKPVFGDIPSVSGMISGSEDFSDLARPHDIPYAFWFFGGTDEKKWDDAVKNDTVHLLPHNHSAKFAPVIRPTLKAGSDAMAIAALTFLKVTFSYHYCGWVGFPFDNQIAPLPFGLLLKWSDGTRLEEVLATEVCRAAGIPTPKITCYGDHPETPHAPISILMTRLPGKELGEAYESLSTDAKATVLSELKMHLATIRQWKSPWGDTRICSITGGPIRSIRVPNHIVGPCETSDEFHDYLLAPARNSFSSEEKFEELLQRARKLRTLERPGVKFTHGDLKHHNILVDEEGHVRGFLDWEAAGWYPDFW
ncbi:hypothetical protein V498_02995 [Pseudogymnoascus sp. VKM F-4517 (FW-2822)]|nr:hypothetical protein V498_02995 [Pseudogymnoascus sp. VKM F-4517 (FW-2822)]